MYVYNVQCSKAFNIQNKTKATTKWKASAGCLLTDNELILGFSTPSTLNYIVNAQFCSFLISIHH